MWPERSNLVGLTNNMQKDTHKHWKASSRSHNAKKMLFYRCWMYQSTITHSGKCSDPCACRHFQETGGTRATSIAGAKIANQLYVLGNVHVVDKIFSRKIFKLVFRYLCVHCLSYDYNPLCKHPYLPPTYGPYLPPAIMFWKNSN